MANPYSEIPRLPFFRHNRTVTVTGCYPDSDSKPTHLLVLDEADDRYMMPVTHLMLSKMVQLVATYDRDGPEGIRIVVEPSANKNAYAVLPGKDWKR